MVQILIAIEYLCFLAMSMMELVTWGLNTVSIYQNKHYIMVQLLWIMDFVGYVQAFSKMRLPVVPTTWMLAAVCTAKYANFHMALMAALV